MGDRVKVTGRRRIEMTIWKLPPSSHIVRGLKACTPSTPTGGGFVRGETSDLAARFHIRSCDYLGAANG
jgi:hypothetical protein